MLGRYVSFLTHYTSSASPKSSMKRDLSEDLIELMAKTHPPASSPDIKKAKSNSPKKCAPLSSQLSEAKGEKGEWNGEKKTIVMEYIFKRGVAGLDYDALAAQCGLAKSQLKGQLNAGNPGNFRGQVMRMVHTLGKK